MVVKSKDNRGGSFKETWFSFLDKTIYEILEKKYLIVILKAEMILAGELHLGKVKISLRNLGFHEILVRASQQHLLDAWHYTLSYKEIRRGDCEQWKFYYFLRLANEI